MYCSFYQEFLYAKLIIAMENDGLKLPTIIYVKGIDI